MWPTAFKDRHKIQDRREDTKYKAISQPTKAIPVHDIQPVTEGIKRRNLLLPLWARTKPVVKDTTCLR